MALRALERQQPKSCAYYLLLLLLFALIVVALSFGPPKLAPLGPASSPLHPKRAAPKEQPAGADTPTLLNTLRRWRVLCAGWAAWRLLRHDRNC